MSDTIKPNLIDRAIEAVAPSFAARRYAARAALSVARGQMSYRGAIAGRASTPWQVTTSIRGGTSRDRHDQAAMRDRARRVFRESAIGRSLLQTETDNVVAEGLSLQMKSSSDEFNKEAEKRFYQFLEGADVAGKMTAGEWFRTSWREPRKDGDGGIALIRRGGFPYLQYIPGDLIENPLTGFDPRTMYDGVECDGAGRPQKFWIRDVDEFGKNISTPILADDFVYLSHRDSPLDVKGTTVYAPIFNEIDQLDEYKEAVVIAARMACIFGLIEKRKNPSAATNGLGTTINSAGETQKAVTLENGMMKVMGTEDQIFQVTAQQPMNQTPDFIRAIFRIICLPFDMPLEIGQKDLSQVNFSGGRIGLIGYYRSCRVKQDWLKSKCWNRIVFWWLSVERDRKRLGLPNVFVNDFPPDYGEFSLNGHEWDFTDPVSEAQADFLEIAMGIKSPQMACEARARDFNDVSRQRAAAREINKSLGIPNVLPSTTRDEGQPATSGAPQP